MAAAGGTDSRASYPCPYCGARADSFETLKAHVLADHRNQAPPAPEGMVALNINGLDYHLHVEPQWTLQEVIHDRLGLTGTKRFCDQGACGACAVIMDGRVILSCMTLAIECGGRAIETIEGIARDEHPLVESYARNHAMQCGYCTPGFVVTAKALLARNPDPDENEIRAAMAGNLCRCGTYPRHPPAVMEAAAVLRQGPAAARAPSAGLQDAPAPRRLSDTVKEAMERASEGDKDADKDAGA